MHQQQRKRPDSLLVAVAEGTAGDVGKRSNYLVFNHLRHTLRSTLQFETETQKTHSFPWAGRAGSHSGLLTLQNKCSEVQSQHLSAPDLKSRLEIFSKEEILCFGVQFVLGKSPVPPSLFLFNSMVHKSTIHTFNTTLTHLVYETKVG